MNLFAFRFLARMLAVIKPRAQKQLDARCYKPKDVQICRDERGNLIDAQGTLTPYMKSQWTNDVL